jgi:sulfur-carrier protein
VKITIHSILGVKDVIGQRELDLEFPLGTTMGDLLSWMKAKWRDALVGHLFQPDTGDLLPHVRVMVNGQTIQFLNGLETVLNEGDEVLLLPLVSGG